jgi:hypothetical protein
MPSHAPEPSPRPSRGGLVRYAVAWVAPAAAVAAFGVALLDRGGDRTPQVTVPPLQQTDLTHAARAAGCSVRHALPGERLNPPVDGTPGADAAAPRVYDEAPDDSMLGAAARRGIIVIQYREGAGEDTVATLGRLQEAVPNGTIVTPNATRMPYALAATGYRRLLGCPRADTGAIEALRLFRGRFIGQGPDVR